MSLLRQVLFGAGLLAALALLVWTQSLRIAVSEGRLEVALQAAASARTEAERAAAEVIGLRDVLRNERASQVGLRLMQNDLRTALAARQRQLETLTRENTALRHWADQPLPDAAARLRQRPALTGADAYRDWLSGRDPLHPASNSPAP
ncbi:LysB family phage lysis regulatory protein [Pseudomonas sp. CFBP 13719]|nr:Rz-like lysis system protein LysB [Pseudomonas sp. CFBP 13719]MBD8682812.1 LysB family phage lysis regulatory protein [Pseudomonas sp. CFBP 13719]